MACNCCNMKKRQEDYVGTPLPKIPQYISGKKKVYIMYDKFVEEFFLVQERGGLIKKRAIVWPIQHCPCCGRVLEPSDIKR